MSGNAQKTPLSRSLNLVAESAAHQAIQLLGKALPCSVVSVSGSIVTVSFELTNIPFTLPNVTVPEFGPEYIRYPTQEGDLGVVLPIDTYLGGISGLGGGTADLSMRSNLSSLVFLPVASKNWSDSINPNQVDINGPAGAVLRDKANTCSLAVNPTGTGVVITTTGGAVLELPLVQATNDAAAAAAGVPIKGLYHNANAVLIRLT